MMVSTMKPSQTGAKHVCADCACKYYDLGKKDAICPKCGGKPVEQKLQSSGRPVRKSRAGGFKPQPGSQMGNQPGLQPVALNAQESDAASGDSPPEAEAEAESDAESESESTAGDDAELPERQPQL